MGLKGLRIYQKTIHVESLPKKTDVPEFLECEIFMYALFFSRNWRSYFTMHDMNSFTSIVKAMKNKASLLTIQYVQGTKYDHFLSRLFLKTIDAYNESDNPVKLTTLIVSISDKLCLGRLLIMVFYLAAELFTTLPFRLKERST